MPSIELETQAAEAVAEAVDAAYGLTSQDARGEVKAQLRQD